LTGCKIWNNSKCDYPCWNCYWLWILEVLVQWQKNELEAFVAPLTFEKKIVTKEMLSDLPPIVQKLLERSNVIGKEIIYCVHLKQIGEMRTTTDGN